MNYHIEFHSPFVLFYYWGEQCSLSLVFIDDWGFHSFLIVPEFSTNEKIDIYIDIKRYSRLPRMGSDISVNSGAFLFFWRLPDFRDGQRTLQLKLYVKALAYYQSSFFLAELFPQRCTVVRLSGSCVFWSWASTLQEFPFYCPFRCCYVEVLWELPLWPCECTSEDHDQ